MCCKQTGEIPSIKTRLSSTDWTGFIIEWTNTKHMSLLFSALFAHIVDRTWPECFNLFRIKGGWGGVFVTHLMLQSWPTTFQLCHRAMRVSSLMQLCYDSQSIGRGSLPHIPSHDWLWLTCNVDPSGPADRQKRRQIGTLRELERKCNKHMCCKAMRFPLNINTVQRFLPARNKWASLQIGCETSIVVSVSCFCSLLCMNTNKIWTDCKPAVF